MRSVGRNRKDGGNSRLDAETVADMRRRFPKVGSGARNINSSE